jgi:hypothetical protein
MKQRVTVVVQYLVNDTVKDITFHGARISTQLFAHNRAIVVVFDEDDHKVQMWHGANVFTIDKTWDRENT